MFPSKLFDGEETTDCYVRPEDYNALAENKYILGKAPVPLFYGACSEDVKHGRRVRELGTGRRIHDLSPLQKADEISGTDTMAAVMDGTEGTLYIEFCPECHVVSMQHQQT